MFTITGNTTSGNATISAVPSTAGIVVNQALSGSGIQSGARVESFIANTSVTMTLTASATATGVTINVALLNYVSINPVSSLIAVIAASFASIQAVSMTPLSSLSGSVAMIVIASAAVSMTPLSALSGSAAMVVSSQAAVAMAPQSSLSGSAAMIVSGQAAVSMTPLSSLSGGVAMVVSSPAAVSMAPQSSLSGEITLAGMTEALKLRQIVNEVLNLWGIEGTCNAPSFAIDRAVGDINSAMQTVWNQSDEQDYWSKETLILNFTDGEDSQDLPDNVQNVVGPCRRSSNKRPLASIGSIGELETFSDIYLDGQTAGEPVAYHIERKNQTGDDPVKTVLRITPAVAGASIAFLLDVVRESPRYMVSDLGLNPVIPIPHRYAESLLLPIVRYRASSFWLFNNTESKATIDRDYQMAMAAIGRADPSPAKSAEKEGVPAK